MKINFYSNRRRKFSNFPLKVGFLGGKDKMGRTYDRELKCGCLVSSDGGGALSPCCYPGYGATEQEIQKCNKAWQEWQKTYD